MRKRNLSEFMCIEMLYDYKSGKLDPLRHQAVEEGLQSSALVREELKKLTIGSSYCEKLKEISVSEPLVDLILTQPKPVEKAFSKFKWGNFPQPVRWALESVIVAVAIALFVTQVPDLFKSNKFESDSVVVKKFDINPSDLPKEEPPVIIESKPQVESAAGVSETLLTESKTDAILVAPTVVAPIIASKEIPELLKPPVVDVPESKPASVAKEEQPKAAKKGNAYVYRMTMFVDDVDVVTPEIVALIQGLSGQKAGEVELGWRRKGGSYFHFSLPLANSLAMQEGLKKYAQFNIIKSAHPRVMPEDTERFILWVEKKSTVPTDNMNQDVEGEGAPVEAEPVENQNTEQDKAGQETNEEN